MRSARLSDIGEFNLIDTLKQSSFYSNSVKIGIGDDCAVLDHDKNNYLLITTDMILEDRHFNRAKTSPEAIGHKALAVNISDIAACAGMPRWCVVSAGFPPSISYKYIKGIHKGMQRIARKFSIDIIGGDTNASEKIVISITLIGTVEKKNLCLRSGAKKGDVIFITGALRDKPDHMLFTPRLKQARYLIRQAHIHSMIDVSDGLISDLSHILRASHKGAIVYESLLPVKPRTASVEKVMNQGEQFELLFTVRGKDAPGLLDNYYPIGEIATRTEGITLVRKNGRRKTVKPGGYTHF